MEHSAQGNDFLPICFVVTNHSDSVPLFFSILFLWVFEIQLLMQIIINRIAVVVDNRRLIRNIKVSTYLCDMWSVRLTIFAVGNRGHYHSRQHCRVHHLDSKSSQPPSDSSVSPIRSSMPYVIVC